MSIPNGLAIVTGANTGIGYEIARGLAKRGIKTILTSRSTEKGQAALQRLKKQNPSLDLVYHQLDIDDGKSVEAFTGWVSNTFGPKSVSVLVNNAAIAFKAADPTPFAGQTAPTLRTNVYSTIAFTEQLLPLLQTAPSQPMGARVVFLASGAGTSALSNCSPEMQARWRSASLTRQCVLGLVQEFSSAVQMGNHRSQGWPNSNYGVSKLAIIAYSKALARRLPKADKILVNSVCPGYCKTNMTSHRGHRSAAKGAEGAIRLSLLPANGPTGGFWRDQDLLW